MSKYIGKQAIVIGAGMGGLTAAKALAGHFERVLVLERDELPGPGTPLRDAAIAARSCAPLRRRAPSWAIVSGLRPTAHTCRCGGLRCHPRSSLRPSRLRSVPAAQPWPDHAVRVAATHRIRDAPDAKAARQRHTARALPGPESDGDRRWCGGQRRAQRERRRTHRNLGRRSRRRCLGPRYPDDPAAESTGISAPRRGIDSG